MKNFLLVASAALFSFGAGAQTGPTTVVTRANYDKQANSQTEQQQAAYKARQDARKDAYKTQTEQQRAAYKAQTEQEKAAYKAQYEARKDPYKAQLEARKDADKAQYEARKDAYKAQHEAAKDADKLEKHERSARGEHAHGGDYLGHVQPAKEHKEHKMK